MENGKIAPAIALRDVNKTYSFGKTTVHALRDIALDVNHGEFIAIAGPSGSGKTSLLNLVGLIDKPDSGSILLRGMETWSIPLNRLAPYRRKLIGFVFQTFNLIPVLNAYENVEYPLGFSGLSRDERRRRVNELLDLVGVYELRHRRPNELSGGERQRVSIARALVNNPEVVVADEPTANLDSKTGRSIIDQMRDLNRRLNVTFIFSSHDPIVLDSVDTVFYLRDGVIEKAAHESG